MFLQCDFVLDFYREGETSHRWGDLGWDCFAIKGSLGQLAEQEMLFLCLAVFRGTNSLISAIHS